MSNKIKETLEKQFDLLAERSTQTYGAELANLTDAMINLAVILESDVQNQAFYAASTRHPYVVQLPIEDLLALHVARAEQARQSGTFRRE